MSLPSGQITQGDSAEWTLTDSRLESYASPGATLYLSDAVTAPVTLTGVIVADVATFSLTPAVSATLPVGKVQWHAVINDGTTERVTLCCGSIQVVADPTSVPSELTDIWNDILAIRAAISGILNDGLQSVSYLDGTYSKVDLDTLYAMEAKKMEEFKRAKSAYTCDGSSDTGGSLVFRPISLR